MHIPLGILPSFQSDAPTHLKLQAGDLLLLATDGFFEWENDVGEAFGICLLEEVIRASRQFSPREIIADLYQAVLEFSNETKQQDDLTAAVRSAHKCGIVNWSNDNRHGAIRVSSLAFLCGLITAVLASAQDLAPRAYIITPMHSNAITLTYSFVDGDLIFDNSVPITGATARVSVPIFSYFHSLPFFGRTANLTASLPYGVGSVRGTVMDAETRAYRSGLFDTSVRFSLNLIGGPAMNVADFLKWKQKTIVGVSVRVVAPTGQYDPTRLINYGANRWAFKPEVGLSRRWGHWVLDSYAAAWFFTTNPEFFSRNQFSPGTNVQHQDSIGAFEGHLSYDVRPRFWASLDGNFWAGGRTKLNGIENPNSLQRNSRIGGTVSLPVTKHQSLKLSYNRGAYIRYGGNFNNISVGWQYSWLGRPN